MSCSVLNSPSKVLLAHGINKWPTHVTVISQCFTVLFCSVVNRLQGSKCPLGTWHEQVQDPICEAPYGVRRHSGLVLYHYHYYYFYCTVPVLYCYCTVLHYPQLVR